MSWLTKFSKRVVLGIQCSKTNPIINVFFFYIFIFFWNTGLDSQGDILKDWSTFISMAWFPSIIELDFITAKYLQVLLHHVFQVWKYWFWSSWHHLLNHVSLGKVPKSLSIICLASFLKCCEIMFIIANLEDKC